MAKSYLHRNLSVLSSEIAAGTPMVVLEPSCCSVFRDEMQELLPSSDMAKRLAENTFTLSEFLDQKANGYALPKLKRKAIVQGHCHHKAIMRFGAEKSVMEKMGLDYDLLNSGCCGMAGSFGYERDKYDVSVACGERVLLPEVRKAGLTTIVMADGFSCKEQIEQETDRHALHLAEVIQLAKRNGEHGPEGVHPERGIVERKNAAQRKSMLRAGIVTGAALLGLAAVWMNKRRG
jgi:Fe-S oxidoreductase